MRKRSDIALRLDDRAAMPRPVDALAARPHLVERGHIGAHGAVRRRDDRGRPGHDMVAGEQRPLLQQGEAEMVGAVARGCHGLQGKPPPLEALAVRQNRVGRVGEIVRRVSPPAPPHSVRTAPRRRSGRQSPL